MAEVVQVLVSPDRRWRVEVRSDGRCQVYEHGFLRATCRRFELETRLADLGVEYDDLAKD